MDRVQKLSENLTTNPKQHSEQTAKELAQTLAKEYRDEDPSILRLGGTLIGLGLRELVKTPFKLIPRGGKAIDELIDVAASPFLPKTPEEKIKKAVKKTIQEVQQGKGITNPYIKEILVKNKILIKCNNENGTCKSRRVNPNLGNNKTEKKEILVKAIKEIGKGAILQIQGGGDNNEDETWEVEEVEVEENEKGKKIKLTNKKGSKVEVNQDSQGNTKVTETNTINENGQQIEVKKACTIQKGENGKNITSCEIKKCKTNESGEKTCQTQQTKGCSQETKTPCTFLNIFGNKEEEKKD